MGKITNVQAAERALRRIQIALVPLLAMVLCLLLVPLLLLQRPWQGQPLIDGGKAAAAQPHFWVPQAIEAIQDTLQRAEVAYGRELVMHTAKYLGPVGEVMQVTNGMNCQNCHLEAGTKPWGNNYGLVASTYPKMRARSGSMEDVFKRVNDCVERSLNGQALDTNTRELQAIRAYILHAGGNVAKGQAAEGAGLHALPYLDRAADTARGRIVYTQRCASCHQPDGVGSKTAGMAEYTYPPLWGDHSYNDGAGLYRLSNFAKYVKYNMPLGVTWDNPLLTDEEAWDVAAYVNTQPHPHFEAPNDWPDKSKKPIDHPQGPYADDFPAQQHKYGPFKPMLKQ